ncbi:heterokaryon incompatibility protein-domain-containing protein [Whalleya microplaca]|nr:heterokaryon incompatibility protein-domain-containing protein [Whalleya microplaca]
MDTTAIQHTLYEEIESTHIRLVKLRKADHAGLIECHLSTMRLDSAPRYVALSYVWGDAQKKTSIRLNGNPFDVTENLPQALLDLLGLGDMTDKLYIWIDAICINQANDVERSQQVPRMTQIFGSAYRVIGSLRIPSESPSDDDVNLLFRLANLVTVDIRHQTPLGDDIGWDKLQLQALDPCFAPFLSGLSCIFSDILSLPWFNRIWVRQEIVLAPQLPAIVIGKNQITTITQTQKNA